MRLRRTLAIVPVVAILLGFQVIAPAAACACGAPAPRPGDDVVVDRELAILSWDGDQERIELLLDMLTASDDVGLIFPTPAPATVTSGDRQTFADIEEAIAPKEVVVDDWWPSLGYGSGAPGGGAPEVLDQVQLGPVQATTLAADDATGLTDWLGANGYAIRDEIAAGLQEYVDKGWYFVALKLTSDAPLDGMLDPVRFTFDSDELVYPMALSKRATALQQARLYVFQDHRARIAGIDDPALTLEQASTTWAGKAPDAVGGLGAYLTVVDLFFSSPASQIPGDLVAVQAGDDEPLQPAYTVTRTLTVFGIPFGVVVILGVVAGILVLLALGTLVARLFRRRTP
ncbi:MAG: hypothetical protein JWP32_628 [Schumannella sp.]|nr:hypothetical protein [Schumannella sp.]